MAVEADAETPTIMRIAQAVDSMLRPNVVLDLLANFTAYATDKKKRRIKIVARHQQYEATNRIMERVVAGHPKKGLIWHFQGSGKSLLMLFAARKLRLHPALKNPTVMVVVDRVDLDSQISSTFYAADTPNLVKADSRVELQRLLTQDARKIIITTIFKFAEAAGVLNDRSNIIAMVDEAHRTQEGDLGRTTREALPNAFLFGLTGTPINRTDRNMFYAFGAEEDQAGYMSRYGFEESIRDGATMPLHFEPRLLVSCHSGSQHKSSVSYARPGCVERTVRCSPGSHRRFSSRRTACRRHCWCRGTPRWRPPTAARSDASHGGAASSSVPRTSVPPS